MPSTLMTNTALSVLRLNTAHFVGTIPQNIGLLTSLREFTIYNNKLIGTIPSSFVNCSQLEVVDLSQNMLTVTLPSYFNVSQSLTVLSVQMNKLSGEIPLAYVGLPNLLQFNVFGNLFSGQIPVAMAPVLDISLHGFGTLLLSSPSPPPPPPLASTVNSDASVDKFTITANVVSNSDGQIFAHNTVISAPSIPGFGSAISSTGNAIAVGSPIIGSLLFST